MKHLLSSERLLLEEVTIAGQKAREVARGLSLGSFIKKLRVQLKMTQKTLAKRASIPQSTVSRIEKGKDAKVNTLRKILRALFCDLLILPILEDSIDSIIKKQARKKAESRIRYLKGTMHLEKQEPDAKLLDHLLQQEIQRLISGPGSKLWD